VCIDLKTGERKMLRLLLTVVSSHFYSTQIYKNRAEGIIGQKGGGKGGEGGGALCSHSCFISDFLMMQVRVC
jgi:hypothetical protein